MPGGSGRKAPAETPAYRQVHLGRENRHTRCSHELETGGRFPFGVPFKGAHEGLTLFLKVLAWESTFYDEASPMIWSLEDSSMLGEVPECR